MKHLLNIAHDGATTHAKMHKDPNKLFNKSGRFRRLLFNDIELYFALTSNATITLLGLFIFTAMW